MFSLFRLNCVKSTLSLSVPRRLVGRSHILYAARWRAARCCLQRQLRCWAARCALLINKVRFVHVLRW